MSAGHEAVDAGTAAGAPVQPVLEGADRTRALIEWNRTQADFPDACTHGLFERQVAATPAAVAVRAGGAQLTYAELDARANRVAHYLRRRGIGPGALVGVSLHRTPAMVAALLGVWKAGAAYVPLDPAYPADRLAFMVEDSGVALLLADARSKLLFPAAGTRLVCLETDAAAIDVQPADTPAGGATPDDLAYVMYTSGSTGRPKGAQIVHRGLVNYLWWAIRAYGVDAHGSAPVHSSISFDLTVTSLYPALLAGGCVDLLPEDVGTQSLIASLRQRRERSVVKITPAHLELLTQQLSADEARGMTRVFVIGGENLTAESLQFWREAAPDTRLINEYGPTETVVGCCVHEVGPADPANGSVPIGRPIANTQLYVLDEALEPVAIGAMGELYIGGAGVARGYLNRPELTAERFLPDRFSDRPGARLYKTGDLARYRADGVLEYLGRVDNQVKVRGYRIELGEIESALAGQPGVQSCAVVVREDSPGNKQLVAYVVGQKGEALALEDVRRFLRDRLPDYMVPAHFVFLDALPLTQNGKVDRRALPAPTYADAAVAQAFVAPRTATEEALGAIWRELLALERVGVHDDVFDLGATSLMVLGAVSRISATLGADIDMQLLFEHPTIEKLAAAIDATAPGAPAAIAPVAPVAARPVRDTEAAAGSAAVAEPHVLPIRFGGTGHELVGLYQRPAPAVDRRESCLLCNPFGQEAVRAHRVYRIIAERLVRGGFHVLRFDYYGTGDSAGDDTEANLDVWVEDVGRASEELARRSGSTRSAWFGLRLGATLAALAAGRASRPPKRVVLWDPILDGRAYLAELGAAHIAARSAPFELRWDIDAELRARVTAEARTEALGYPLDGVLRQQIGALSQRAFAGLRSESVEFIGADPGRVAAELKPVLEGTQALVGTRVLQSSISWTVNEMLSESIVLPEDMRKIAATLAGEA